MTALYPNIRQDLEEHRRRFAEALNRYMADDPMYQWFHRPQLFEMALIGDPRKGEYIIPNDDGTGDYLFLETGRRFRLPLETTDHEP